MPTAKMLWGALVWGITVEVMGSWHLNGTTHPSFYPTPLWLTHPGQPSKSTTQSTLSLQHPPPPHTFISNWPDFAIHNSINSHPPNTFMSNWPNLRNPPLNQLPPPNPLCQTDPTLKIIPLNQLFPQHHYVRLTQPSQPTTQSTLPPPNTIMSD